MSLPRVCLIGCGGTISSVSADVLDTIDYPDSGTKLSARDVLERIPDLRRIAEITPVTFRDISSTALTVSDLFALRDLIMELAESDPDLRGVVVLHGTGALEEAAFFLHLTFGLRLPVVVTGAQRPLSARGSDAPGNLLAAVRVAAASQSAGLGVLVVMNDEIHSARDVVKTSTYRLQAFRAPDAGMLGQVDGDRIAFFRTLVGRHTLASPFAGQEVAVSPPRIDIIYSYLGGDDVLIDASFAAGARGLVSAGFAPGLVTPAMMKRFEELARGNFPIVLCSRAGSGRVADRARALAAGLISGEDFSPQKSRILLMLGLLAGLDSHGLRDAFRSI